jgi:ATP-dependent DNA helicase RecG
LTDFYHTPIEYLKGVGSMRAELLQKELGIFKISDLLRHYPHRYVDRSKIHSISELHGELPHIQLQGKILSMNEVGSGRTKRLHAKFVDQTGQIDLVWFKGVKWLKENTPLNQDLFLFGKPSLYNGKLNISHPEIETPNVSSQKSSLRAVYPLTERLRTRKLDNKVISKLVFNALTDKRLFIEDYMPESILKERQLPTLRNAIRMLHMPINYEDVLIAQRRIKFDEFFFLLIKIQRLKKKQLKLIAPVFSEVGEKFNGFYNDLLQFELTGAQKRVIKEIRNDMRSGFQMNRLLQGDVGSGKSIVALLCILIAIDNGYQASLMAPTEILANQHFEGMKDDLNRLGLKVALLTGSTKKKAREQIFEGLKTGDIHILIGTHALIEDKVLMKNQGLVIIDEQHRFGVAQRAKLWQKSTLTPHFLVMTATPIPRTLAMTVYGDLDVSKIDEMPVGRKTIVTAHRFEEHRTRVIGFIREQITLGRQVYVVYPLIEESEKLDYKNAMDGFGMILEYFPRPKYQTDILHGKMKPADKDDIMERFKNGETDILVSTTVIEVGINVINATMMVIESAEKFGLAQLHQLRGRVGRGKDQSYCILMTKDQLSPNAHKRIKAMVHTSDGFELAELDLKLRGPGDIEGTRQSGLLDLIMASIVKDEALLDEVRTTVEALLAADPQLLSPEHRILKQTITSMRSMRDWSRIS